MCKFDPAVCTVSCQKYPMCSYFSIQNQLNNIQSQLNFILSALTKNLEENEIAKLNIQNIVQTLINIEKDSESMKNFEKENPENEKETY